MQVSCCGSERAPMSCSDPCAACQKNPKEQTFSWIVQVANLLKQSLGHRNCCEALIATHTWCHVSITSMVTTRPLIVPY